MSLPSPHPSTPSGRNATGQASGRTARIVLDVTGGDRPQIERLAGALEAARDFVGDTHIILCGPQQQIERDLATLGGKPANVSVVDAPERIGMHESPVKALRSKKRSSIVVGVGLVADGQADAFVSAGNTGAVAAASTLKLGRLKGVQRPGIAVAMRMLDHTVVAIDVGASVDSRPMHLLHFAIMAEVFAREVVGVAKPRVGLLSVGEEDTKGNDLTKQTFDLLATADLDFVGNVEPKLMISKGGCDVIVCDGFVGNILLKFGEGLLSKMTGWLREQIPQKLSYKIGYWFLRKLLRHMKACADYSEYGGAPLLGINGVTIITHGTSDAHAIRNAIREARSFVENKVTDHIVAAIATDAARRAED
jgi:phosphate acyltransferase